MSDTAREVELLRRARDLLLAGETRISPEGDVRSFYSAGLPVPIAKRYPEGAIALDRAQGKAFLTQVHKEIVRMLRAGEIE